MKKLLLFTTTLFLAFGLFAQNINTVSTSGEVIFSEGFEGTTGITPPPGWVRIQPAGWAPWYTGSGIAGACNPHTGNRMANHNYDPGKARDAWLISTPIAFEATKVYSVSFWLHMAGYQSELDFFEMKIANAPTSEAMTASSVEIYKNTTEQLKEWTRIVGIFAPDVSGEYYLGFHAFSPNDVGNVIAIDDIEVVAAVANNLSITAPVYPLTQIPITQKLLNLPATVNNLGANPQTNVSLSLDYGGENIGTTTLPSIESGNSVIMNVDVSEVYVTLGEAALKHTVTQTEPDSDPTDNTVTQSITGTLNTFAVDDGTISYNFGYNNFPISYGNIFPITQTTTLQKVEMRFGPSKVTSFGVSLYKVIDDELVTPSIFSIQAIKPETTGWITITVPETVLEPGNYYLCVDQQSTVSLNLTSDGSHIRTAWYWNNYKFGAINLTGVNVYGAMFIRMVVPPPPCQPPTNLVVYYNIPDCSVTLTWNATANAKKYNIYKDGIIVQPNYEGTNYTEIFPNCYGECIWSVTAICTDDSESEPISETLTALICDGVKENEKVRLNIVPNPASNEITISSENNFNSIEVVNFLGQTVISESVYNNSVLINVSNLNKGLYLVRITSENGTSVGKFVKE